MIALPLFVVAAALSSFAETRRADKAELDSAQILLNLGRNFGNADRQDLQYRGQSPPRRKPGASRRRLRMISALEIMPVLALALAIVFLPLLGRP